MLSRAEADFVRDSYDEFFYPCSPKFTLERFKNWVLAPITIGGVPGRRRCTQLRRHTAGPSGLMGIIGSYLRCAASSHDDIVCALLVMVPLTGA